MNRAIWRAEAAARDEDPDASITGRWFRGCSNRPRGHDRRHIFGAQTFDLRNSPSNLTFGNSLVNRHTTSGGRMTAHRPCVSLSWLCYRSSLTAAGCCSTVACRSGALEVSRSPPNGLVS